MSEVPWGSCRSAIGNCVQARKPVLAQHGNEHLSDFSLGPRGLVALELEPLEHTRLDDIVEGVVTHAQ